MCAAPDCKRWLRTRDVSGYCGVCAALPCGACRAPGGYWLEHGECKPERPLCHHERALGHRLGIGHLLGCEPERDPAYIQRCEARRVLYGGPGDTHWRALDEAGRRAHLDWYNARTMIQFYDWRVAAEGTAQFCEAAVSAASFAIGVFLIPRWEVESGATVCRGCAAPGHSGNCKCGDASCERCK